MSVPPSPSYRSLMIAAAILTLIGWSGLYLLLTQTLPTLGPRWLLFFLLTLALTGSSLPFVWLLQRRFGRQVPASSSVLLREALMVGLFGAVCLWLRVNRSLTVALAVLLAVGLLAIEWILLALERTAWRPGR
ncbi:MAG TPA: hypothetical protein VJ123_07965 [Anaerolineales bacterium]|nr:hypothetical protein [Anaerolineales bacterium]